MAGPRKDENTHLSSTSTTFHATYKENKILEDVRDKITNTTTAYPQLQAELNHFISMLIVLNSMNHLSFISLSKFKNLSSQIKEGMDSLKTIVANTGWLQSLETKQAVVNEVMKLSNIIGELDAFKACLNILEDTDLLGAIITEIQKHIEQTEDTAKQPLIKTFDVLKKLANSSLLIARNKLSLSLTPDDFVKYDEFIESYDQQREGHQEKINSIIDNIHAHNATLTAPIPTPRRVSWREPLTLLSHSTKEENNGISKPSL